MTTVTKYTNAGSAAEVDARAQRYLTEHQGATYREALGAVLRSDKSLAQAYAEPAQRVKRVTPTPAVPVTSADEREVLDWVLRALEDGKAGTLPGALGQLALEADKFAKVGMPLEEAARRAMDSHPHLVTMAKVLLTEDKPEPPGNPAGFAVHARAEALMQEHPELDYRAAVGAALSEDPDLKAAYAGVQR
jgi:hypothetical protein